MFGPCAKHGSVAWRKIHLTAQHIDKMAPGVKLSIKAGANADSLVPVPVNYDKEAVVIDMEAFRGRIAVRVKGYGGDVPDGLEPKSAAPYFDAPYGSQMTYSIQMQGACTERVSSG